MTSSKSASEDGADPTTPSPIGQKQALSKAFHDCLDLTNASDSDVVAEDTDRFVFGEYSGIPAKTVRFNTPRKRIDPKRYAKSPHPNKILAEYYRVMAQTATNYFVGKRTSDQPAASQKFSVTENESIPATDLCRMSKEPFAEAPAQRQTESKGLVKTSHPTGELMGSSHSLKKYQRECDDMLHIMDFAVFRAFSQEEFVAMDDIPDMGDMMMMLEDGEWHYYLSRDKTRKENWIAYRNMYVVNSHIASLFFFKKRRT